MKQKVYHKGFKESENNFKLATSLKNLKETILICALNRHVNYICKNLKDVE